ncbi:hypothetical protein IKG05_01795 [Candidatus Saccharibacteria bacterium]|nr:hypothetical protein [Candidatus Saccharibacteria bacterium]
MKKILSGMIAVVLGALLVMGGSVYADDTTSNTSTNTESCTCEDGRAGTRPKTAIIGNGTSTGCECGGGEGVKSILNLVVDIMTVGVGILGVIGITVVGIQYLTAGGNEEKTRKSKRRMFEIVIGLVAYVLIYAALKWLLPSFGG